MLASNAGDASKSCGEFGKNEIRLLKKEKKEKMQKFVNVLFKLTLLKPI